MLLAFFFLSKVEKKTFSPRFTSFTQCQVKVNCMLPLNHIMLLHDCYLLAYLWECRVACREGLILEAH